MKTKSNHIHLKSILFVTQIFILTLSSLTSSLKAQGQNMTNEEKFHEIFTTAGYATAFGAALGAATLSFQKRPENHLRFVAVGASLGFIGGSILGAYTVFSPVFLVNGGVKSNDDFFASRSVSAKKSFGLHPLVSELSRNGKSELIWNGIGASLQYPLN